MGSKRTGATAASSEDSEVPERDSEATAVSSADSMDFEATADHMDSVESMGLARFGSVAIVESAGIEAAVSSEVIMVAASFEESEVIVDSEDSVAASSMGCMGSMGIEAAAVAVVATETEENRGFTGFEDSVTIIEGFAADDATGQLSAITPESTAATCCTNRASTCTAATFVPAEDSVGLEEIMASKAFMVFEVVEFTEGFAAAADSGATVTAEVSAIIEAADQTLAASTEAS